MTSALKYLGTYTPPAIEMPGATLWPNRLAPQDVFEELDVLDIGEPTHSAGTARSAKLDTRRTNASVVRIHGPKDRIKTRFRMLKRLPANHDGEGAAAPDGGTIDKAMVFIDSVRLHPEFFATLDDDGCAVIELEERGTGFFGDITFRPDGTIECYRRQAGRLSVEAQGMLSSDQIREFLEAELRILF